MILENTPLITCVCVTKNRPELIKRAITCYLHQTYPNKNLVILSQGDEKSNDQIRSYVQLLHRSDILYLTAPSFMSLGAMRNTSVELATGQIICQWDDDDLYHPDRIKTQYKALRQSNKNVASVYCDFLKYFENSGEIYWCDWSGEPKLSHKFLCGSIMFYKSLFHVFSFFYPETGNQSSKEEDLNVLQKLIYKGVVSPVFAGHQYIYVHHGVNTYNLAHHQLTLDTTWGKKVYSEEEILGKKSLLEATFDLVGLEKPVKVCSLEGMAFQYTPKGVGIEV